MPPKTFLALALLGVGCATPSWRQRSEEERKAHVLRLAAQDLQCPKLDPKVSEDAIEALTTAGCFPEVFGATAFGCGQEAHYSVDEQGELRLVYIFPAEPELRQWTQEWLQAQRPSTPFTFGKSVSVHDYRSLEVLSSQAETGSPWKLSLWLQKDWCNDARPRAPQPGTDTGPGSPTLDTSACGGHFEVFVSYEGPPALLPAPQGLHLQHLADALVAKVKVVSRPKHAAPAVAAPP